MTADNNQGAVATKTGQTQTEIMQRIVNLALERGNALPGEILIVAMIQDERGVILPLNAAWKDDKPPTLFDKVCMERGFPEGSEGVEGFVRQRGKKIAERFSSSLSSVLSSRVMGLVVGVNTGPADIQNTAAKAITGALAVSGHIGMSKRAD